MSNRLAGTVFFKMDGQMIDIDGSITINPGEIVREPIVSSGGVIGYSESQKSPSVEVVGYLTKDQLKSLYKSTDITATCEMANGATYVLSGAFVSGEPSVDTEAGTTSITLSGVHGEFI
jgi:hypothetical protein